DGGDVDERSLEVNPGGALVYGFLNGNKRVPAGPRAEQEERGVDAIDYEGEEQPAGRIDIVGPCQAAVGGLEQVAIEHMVGEVGILGVEAHEAAVAVVGMRPERAIAEALGAVVLAAAQGDGRIGRMGGDAVEL